MIAVLLLSAVTVGCGSETGQSAASKASSAAPAEDGQAEGDQARGAAGDRRPEERRRRRRELSRHGSGFSKRGVDPAALVVVRRGLLQGRRRLRGRPHRRELERAGREGRQGRTWTGPGFLGAGLIQQLVEVRATATRMPRPPTASTRPASSPWVVLSARVAQTPRATFSCCEHPAIARSGELVTRAAPTFSLSGRSRRRSRTAPPRRQPRPAASAGCCSRRTSATCPRGRCAARANYSAARCKSHVVRGTRHNRLRGFARRRTRHGILGRLSKPGIVPWDPVREPKRLGYAVVLAGAAAGGRAGDARVMHGNHVRL